MLFRYAGDFWALPATDSPYSTCILPGPRCVQGRDGIGACPCCGTGVVFQRSVLVSIGGQAYGSVTEDANTSFLLLGAGFSSL